MKRTVFQLLSFITFFVFSQTPSSKEINNLNEKWTCYTNDDILLMDDSHRILGVFDYSDESLWVITERGINTFDGNQWKKIEKEETKLNRKSIGSYLADSKNRVWLGSGSPDIFFDGYLTGPLYGGGITIFDGSNWEAQKTKDIGIKMAVVTDMFESSNGDIWLVLSSHKPSAEVPLLAKGALLRYHDNNWEVYRSKDLPCVDCAFVKGFYQYDNDKLLIWSSSYMFYFENNSFTRFTKEDGYNIYGIISATFTDSDNNFWVASPGKVARYDGKQWKQFNRKNGLPSGFSKTPLLGFTESLDGKIMLSTFKGLYTFDGNSEWVRGQKQMLVSNAAVDNENRIWLPTIKGLEIKDEGNSTLQKEFTGIWSIFPDNNGGLWALSRKKGAKRYADGKWTHYTDKNELPSNKIQFGHVAKNGTVWIGTKKGICSCRFN